MPRKTINQAALAEPPGLLDTASATGGPGTNVPELSVSELSSALKRTVEDRFGFVRLRGEISNYRGPHSSGHAYFSIKDEGARIDAVVWKAVFARMRVKPEEGLEVVATGKITTFPGKSSYQIVVETLEPAGVGALMAVLDERRRRLAAEGLFDAARKRVLPFLPHVIGVITSPTGAVIRDILHRVSARFPRHVIVWPVRVQGETSGREVAAAIQGFNAAVEGGVHTRPHLIIVARGGGSLEDLWGFNDEAVVRAVAEGTIPLISAVGHETDWTLIDHVADLRAPTPTGAAELALPVLAELQYATERLRLRQHATALRLVDKAKSELRALVRLLPAGADLLALPRQRLDRAATQLPAATRTSHDQARLTLARWAARLGAQSPQVRLARASQRLIGVGERLGRAQSYGVERCKSRLAGLDQRLAAAFAARVRLLRLQHAGEQARLSAVSARLERARTTVADRQRDRLDRAARLLVTLGHKGVLGRGYAIVRDAGGATVRSVAELHHASSFSVELIDGRIDARAEADRSGIMGESSPLLERSARPSRAKKEGGRTSGTSQGSLFDA